MTTLFIFAMAAISLLLAALAELGEVGGGILMGLARMPSSKKSRVPLVFSLAALALFLWGVGRIFMHVHIAIK